MSQHIFLKIPGGHRIMSCDILARELLDRRKSLALRRIGDKQHNDQRTDKTSNGGDYETRLPAKRAYNKSSYYEREEFAYVRGRTEYAVEGSALGLREPAGQADHSWRRAHRLHPTVYAPEDCK